MVEHGVDDAILLGQVNQCHSRDDWAKEAIHIQSTQAGASSS